MYLLLVAIVTGAQVRQRGVKLDSFVWDDGWDDHRSLWKFHDKFPNGFTDVGRAADTFGSGIGVWVSPWGGCVQFLA